VGEGSLTSGLALGPASAKSDPAESVSTFI